MTRARTPVNVLEWSFQFSVAPGMSRSGVCGSLWDIFAVTTLPFGKLVCSWFTCVPTGKCTDPVTIFDPNVERFPLSEGTFSVITFRPLTRQCGTPSAIPGQTFGFFVLSLLLGSGLRPSSELSLGFPLVHSLTLFDRSTVRVPSLRRPQ